MIREKDIALYINNKINNHVNWEDLTKFEEAKTYYKLTSKDQIEGVMLDKDSFTKGDSESFKQWMLEQHPEIKYDLSIRHSINKKEKISIRKNEVIFSFSYCLFYFRHFLS